MRWTKAYRKTHGKELMYDSTLDFEKRREEPVRYNRELYIKTVQAIEKIEAIKQAREKRFKNARIKEAKRRNVDAIDRLLVRRPEYIKDKAVSDKYKEKNRASIAAQLAQLKQKSPNSKKSSFQTRMTSLRRWIQITIATWRKKIWMISKPNLIEKYPDVLISLIIQHTL